jgi:hypothetical protein
MRARRRVFTVAEANALLPHLREVLGRIQELRRRVGEGSDQLKILEVLWGGKVAEPSNPDHGEFLRHRRAIGGAVQEIEVLVREEILALGIRFPQGGLEHGLLDFPSILDGRWVYLCWRPEEAELLAWHELNAGFGGRKPLTPAVARRMGRVRGGDEVDDRPRQA